MASNSNKTQRTEASVEAFLISVPDEQRRADALALLALMRSWTGLEPRLWGADIVGFGEYHYRYESGREGDFFKVGFSPRKQSMSLYLMSGFERYEELLSRLGKYRTGKACLYLKRLSDADEAVLRELITEAFQYMNEKYG